MNTQENTLNAATDVEALLADLNEQAEQLTAAASEKAADEKQAKAKADRKAKAQAKKQAPAEVKGVEAADEAPVTVVHVAGDLKEMIGAVSKQKATARQAKIVDAFAQRTAYEAANVNNPEGKTDKIAGYAKHMTSMASATLFAAINLDPSFINREESKGKRYNIYALDKINDLVQVMDAGILQNKINRAILLSMLNFRDNGQAFTGEAVNGAISATYKVDKAISKHLVRHTVAPSTVPTQRSSSMNALETLGIVTSNGLKGNFEVFTLTDTPQTRRIEQVLRAA